MNSVLETELATLKEIIVNTVPVEQIYLFGSYANGIPHKDSDLDLYVVLSDNIQMRLIDAIIKIKISMINYEVMRSRGKT